MKKILIVSGLVLGIIMVTWYISTTFNDEGESLPVSGDEVVFPPASENSDTAPPGKIIVTGQSGKKIEINDFIGNGEMVVDTVNPGNYLLSGKLDYCLGNGVCPSYAESQDYQISYSEKYQKFNILLLKQPLSLVRFAAERYLQAQLGITIEEMCALNYTLGVTTWVDERYSGKELGFSFCTGSVSLE